MPTDFSLPVKIILQVKEHGTNVEVAFGYRAFDKQLLHILSLRGEISKSIFFAVPLGKPLHVRQSGLDSLYQ
jgi:hypothetical protein